MIAAFVLIAGILIIMIIGSGALVFTGMSNILTSLVPFAPWLVMVGTLLLILTELLLFFGSKEDKRAAFHDLAYLVPTCIISGALWYVADKLLW